jgi:hypothetical protein
MYSKRKKNFQTIVLGDPEQYIPSLPYNQNFQCIPILRAANSECLWTD